MLHDAPRPLALISLLVLTGWLAGPACLVLEGGGAEECSNRSSGLWTTESGLQRCDMTFRCDDGVRRQLDCWEPDSRCVSPGSCSPPEQRGLMCQCSEDGQIVETFTSIDGCEHLERDAERWCGWEMKEDSWY